MSSAENKMPVYDERVKRILSYLEQGMSREEVAKKFQYSSYRSMEIYMSRKNFRWDKRTGTYVPAQFEEQEMNYEPIPSDKVRRIIAEIGKEDADLKEVAKQMGFENHKEMATYMKSKGYDWSAEVRNYVLLANEPSNKQEEQAKPNLDKVVSLQSFTSQTKAKHSSLERFLPILELLEDNYERLHDLLAQQKDVGQMPRFTLPGRFVTKSVHMTDTLDQMVRDFSKEKNINQREIFEVALIEFFQKYGYDREVKTLLQIH